MNCLNDSIALHLLCTVFLSLLYQLNLRSLGIRSWRLGTPGLDNIHHYIVTIFFFLVMRTFKIDCLSNFQIHNPLQCSCLENSVDRRAWWAIWSHRESDATEHENRQTGCQTLKFGLVSGSVLLVRMHHKPNFMVLIASYIEAHCQ